MKPDKYKDKLKEYRAAAERIGELYDLIWKLPPIDVSKERIFAGDWRYFVVRKDILRSSLGETIQKIVDITQHACLGRRNDPKSYTRWNYRSNKYEDYQDLKDLSDKEYKSYNFSTKESKYFRRIVEIRSFGSKNKEIHSWRPIIPEWMLEYAYKPAYMLETRDAGYELQSELDKLNDFMRRENAWEKMGKSNREWDWDLPFRKALKKEADKEIKEFLES